MTRSTRLAVFAAAAVALLPACTPDRAAAPRPSPSASMSLSASPGSPSASLSPSPSPTPSAAEQPTLIAVIGDFGIDDDPVRRVVGAMTRFGGGRPLDAVVTTGDNAYQRGRPREARFARDILQPALGPRTRLFAALGNHDVATEGGEHVMDAFDMDERWYRVVVGPVEFVILDSNRIDDDDQLDFLRRTMDSPRRAPFRAVVFHHPAWSCSAHRPNEDVRRLWLPLIGDNADLLLAGHNHTYERFAGPGQVPLITTGGGGASLYPSSRPACRGTGTIQVIKNAHHALRLTATSQLLVVEAIGTDNVVLDTLRLTPR